MDAALLDQGRAGDECALSAGLPVPEEDSTRPACLSFAFDESALTDLYSPSRLRLRRSSSACSDPSSKKRGSIHTHYISRSPASPASRSPASPARRLEAHHPGLRSAPCGSAKPVTVSNAAGWAAAVASEETRKLQELTRAQASELRAREYELMMAHEANRSLRAKLGEATMSSKVPHPSSPSALHHRQQPEPEPSLPLSTDHAKRTCTDGRLCSPTVQSGLNSEAISSGTQESESCTRDVPMPVQIVVSQAPNSFERAGSKSSDARCEDELRDLVDEEPSRHSQARRRCQTLQQRNKQLQQKLDECEAAFLRLACEFPRFPCAPDSEQRPDVTFADMLSDIFIGCVGKSNQRETRDQTPSAMQDIFRILDVTKDGVAAEHQRWARCASGGLHLSEGERNARFVGADEQNPRGFAITAKPVPKTRAMHCGDSGQGNSIERSGEANQKEVSFNVRVDSICEERKDGLAIGFTSTSPSELLPQTADLLGGVWLAGFNGKMYLSSDSGRLCDCAWKPADLECGDCIRATMANGEFAVFVNGDEMCRATVEIPAGCHLYGIVDLTGSVDRVTLLD